METEQKKPEKTAMNKNIYIIGAVAAVIVIALAAFLMMRGGNKTQQDQTSRGPVTEAVIPTVDASVKVEVKAETDPKKFDMSIKGIPDKTTSIEYEITYETQDDGIQGFNSPVDLKSGQTTYEKKGFLLGTCSTGGKCTYHKVTSPLKVNIKFVGSYGEKLFAGEFTL